MDLLEKTLHFIILFLLFECRTKDTSLYESHILKVERVTERVFIHTSYLRTFGFGKVNCNGAIFVDGKEALIFDTPTSNASAEELINFVQKSLGYAIVAVIPTHYHNDCIGGIAAFSEHQITAWASAQTIDLANTDSLELAATSFNGELKFQLANETIDISYFGAGHTQDNVVAYYPSEKVLFGGCLIKSIGASKGYLAEADTSEWSTTVASILSTYDIDFAIPGHGKVGNDELLNYTVSLFEY